MPKKMKLILIGLFIVGFGLLATSAVKVKAQSEVGRQSTTTGGSSGIPEVENLNRGNQAAANGEPNKANFDSNTVDNVLASTYCLIFPCSQSPNQMAQGGALHGVARAMAVMYEEPPATTGRYIADVLNNAGIATPAYAQGLGFAALNPIMGTWKVFRDIAYLFFVIIFVAIGFLIMFRQKVGQTAVTAQQAIPHIIIALLAVTFSYAIAGFLIDLMYLIMFFLAGLLGSLAGQGSNVIQFVNMSIFGVFIKLIGGAVTGTNNAIGSIIEAGIGGDIGEFIGDLGGLVMAVVVGVALLIGFFRLFFELLQTYLNLVLSITFAPLLLMTGAIPGKSAFSSWIKTIIGNLAAFPAVLLIILFYQIITSSINSSGQTVGGFMPPYLIGQGSAQGIIYMVGIGLLLIAENIVKQVKKMFGGGGGIFEQFVGNFKDALSRGWSGGELIPGLALTNTGKYGLSARNIVNKPFFGTKESREASDAEKHKEWQGWQSRLHRYTGGYGLAGSAYELYKRQGAKTGQEQPSTAMPRDAEVTTTVANPERPSLRKPTIKSGL